MNINGKAWLAIVGLYFCSTAYSESSLNNKDVFITALITFGPTFTATGALSESSQKIKNWIFVKDDAAAFVATDGAVRGPFLESALEVLREDESLNSYSDFQLTHALLTG